jgi:hypothetical protein
LNADGTQPTLIDFTLGSGHVVASQNTLEWTNAGEGLQSNPEILDNIIKYMFRIGFDTLKWNASDVDSDLMDISINPGTDVMQITPVAGAIGSDRILLTLIDTINGTMDSQWVNVIIAPDYPMGKLLWETEVPIELIDSLDLENEFNIFEYNLTGKFYVEGVLFSSFSQEIARDVNSFYVVNSDLALTVETDKRIYKPGETIQITAEATNNAAVGETNINFTLGREGSGFYSESFDLAAGETRTFTTELTADSSFMLDGQLKGVKVQDQITVESPTVNMVVSGPDVVGYDEFQILVKLENTGNTDADLVLDFSGETHTLNLAAGQTTQYKRAFAITEDATYTVVMTGDVSDTITKSVNFGPSAGISLNPQPVSPEGTVEIPVTGFNNGPVDFELDVDFVLTAVSTGADVASDSRSLYLPALQDASAMLVFKNLSEGTYVLSFSSSLTSGQTEFRVAKYNQVDILTLNIGTALTQDGNMPVSLTVVNTGANDFIGSLVFDTGFYYDVSSLSLDIGQSVNVTIDVPLNIGAGDYGAIAQVLYNRDTIDEKKFPFSLNSRFKIVSLPADSFFKVGQKAELSIDILNEGMVSGSVEVAIKGGDMLDAVQSEWLPVGDAKTFTFGFYVFEELVANWYDAVITVTNLDTGLVEEFPISYYVDGYNIDVAMESDKSCYSEGDTAVMGLHVTNNSALGKKFEAVVSLNEHYLSKDFLIGGMPVLERVDTALTPGTVRLLKEEKFDQSETGRYERKLYNRTFISNYKIQTSRYAKNGSLVSAVQHVESSEEATLTWNADVPDSTSLVVETRTGFVIDPDETWSSWQPQTSGEKTESPVGEFLQYRITLSTTDDSLTPVLHDIALSIPNQDISIIHTSQDDFEKMPVVIEFDVPVSFTGQKLFYGVYSETGWGIHLNSMYLCEGGQNLTMYADKQVYDTGESVTVHVHPHVTGTLEIWAPEYETSFTISTTDPFEFTFELPDEMMTDSYDVFARFLGEYYNAPFDVNGYDVYVHDRRLDKEEYYLNQSSMSIELDVYSSDPMTDVTAVGWIYFDDTYYDCFETDGLNLDTGITDFEIPGEILAEKSGYAEVIIEMYKMIDNDPYGMFLTADSASFDLVRFGDLDRDGAIDRDDVNILKGLRNQSVDNCPVWEEECDLDGDGRITVMDARKLLRMCDCPRCLCN